MGRAIHLYWDMVLALVCAAEAQKPIVYPAKGQSPQQQGQDDAQCAAWAKQSTGIDPAVVAANPPHNRQAPAVGGSQRLRGAARGAAGGAAIGAITETPARAQEWGRWWALWPGGQRQQQAAQNQQGQAQQRELIQTYYRGYGACMEAAATPSSKGGSMTRFLPLVAALAWLAAGTASAGDFDGSKLLICAPVEAIDCAPGEDCTKGRPDDIGAPSLRIDFAHKRSSAPSARRRSHGQSNNQLLLQGTELGYGWTLALDQESGTMTATLVNREEVFVLFGSCTPL